MSNDRIKGVLEIIEDVKADICNNYCKYPHIWDEEAERLADIRERMRPTQWLKGNRPMNEMAVGDIVVNSDGYKLIKVQMMGTIWERWHYLHREVWQQHNGPIPEGMLVTFKDSNRLNCDIDNLVLISKAENAALTGHHYRFKDPDLTMAGLSVVRLENAIREKKKGGKHDS